MSLGKTIRKYRKIKNLTQEEMATLEKDADTVIATVKEMLSCVEQIWAFRDLPLYEHMDFKELRADFIAETKENLLKCFREEESFGFLKNDRRWQELTKQ